MLRQLSYMEKLEEQIYMECPEGLEHEDDNVLLLEKSIYGLVQVARQYYKKWTKALKELGFSQSEVNPCLFYKEKIYIGTYVDNNFIIGEDGEIKQFIRDLNKMDLKVTVEEGFSDYLSCNIVMNKDMTKA
jgi:hypothetical protein